MPLVDLRRLHAALSACAILGTTACATGPTRSSLVTTEAAVHPVVVRYQVADVSRAIAFYTERLGFQLESRAGDTFAAVTLDHLRLLLSGPGSSGSRPMPDGRLQGPGGWNRIVLDVDDLDARIATLREAGATFRNEIETGPGGRQIQIEDPDGNPIELHEPPGR